MLITRRVMRQLRLCLKTGEKTLTKMKKTVKSERISVFAG
jgi:hypothetical protein